MCSSVCVCVVGVASVTSVQAGGDEQRQPDRDPAKRNPHPDLRDGSNGDGDGWRWSWNRDEGDGDGG